jgi:glycogen synthase
VTFEDMTVAQAIALRHPAVSVLSESALRKWRDRQRRAYERALACCAASAWAARSIVRDYGIPPERVRVVGFGRNHAPKAVERDWSRPRFLWVGREWERKGGPDVVEAFAELRREVPEARLDLVGEHPPLAEDGVEGHGPLGLERPDERARLERLYEAATCFVMPSRYEPFGIVHVEAAAAGIPSIGTSVGGPAQVIGTEAGRIVDPGDRPALVRALTELSDAETAARMGAAAMRRSHLFTWEAVAARVLRAGRLPASEVDHPELEWELDPRHGVAAERDAPPELGRRAVGDRPER